LRAEGNGWCPEGSPKSTPPPSPGPDNSRPSLSPFESGDGLPWRSATVPTRLRTPERPIWRRLTPEERALTGPKKLDREGYLTATAIE
jgi:hypothetical protein